MERDLLSVDGSHPVSQSLQQTTKSEASMSKNKVLLPCGHRNGFPSLVKVEGKSWVLLELRFVTLRHYLS